jgi:hypothetical protein
MKRLLILCVAFTVAASAMPASAGVIGRGVRTQTTSTASWGVSVVNQNNVVVNQDYPITLVSTGNTSYNYFSLRNTGTLTTNTFSVLIFQDVLKNKNLRPGEVIIERCDGAWNLTTNTCSVTPIQIATGSSTSFDITSALAVGSEVKLRARTPNNNQSVGLSLRVVVPRSSVRGGQATNS